MAIALQPEELKAARDRLRRIEGQIRGIQRMLGERDCAEVLTQIAAARSALQKVALFILQSYARECLSGAREGEIERLLQSYLTLT
jgi:DNA-binding FrmR family transcriptional regulator